MNKSNFTLKKLYPHWLGFKLLESTKHVIEEEINRQYYVTVNPAKYNQDLVGKNVPTVTIMTKMIWNNQPTFG